MNENHDDARRQANRLIEALGKTVGLEQMAFDENGRCDLSFDTQNLTIGYDEMAGQIYLEAPVMDMPTSPAKDFYSWVLADNFTSFTNGIGCLALDSEEEEIVWLDRRPAKDMDQKHFEDWLSASVERAEYWVRQLNERVNAATVGLKVVEDDVALGMEMVFRP